MAPKKTTVAESAFHWNDEQSLKLVMLFLHTKDPDMGINGWDDFQPALESLFDDKVTQKSAKNQWAKLKKAYLENGGNEIKDLLKGAPSSSDAPQAKGKGRKTKASNKAEASKLTPETVETSEDEVAQEANGDTGKQRDIEMATDGEDDDNVDDDGQHGEAESDRDDKDGAATRAADDKGAEDGENAERGQPDASEDTGITTDKASEDKSTKRTDKPDTSAPKTSTVQAKKRKAPAAAAAGRQSKKPRCSASASNSSSSSATTKTASVAEQRKLNPGKSLDDFMARN